MDDGSALHLALRCGMARYLRLQELLAAANSCALLRCDAALVRQSVMETTDFDWFPAVLTDVAALARDSGRLHDAWTEEGQEWQLPESEHKRAPSPRRTQLLGLAVFLKRIVMRWCFVYENASPDGPWRDVMWSVRPALIPVRGFQVERRRVQKDPAKQAAEIAGLRARLNDMVSGFGDSITGSLNPSRPSKFGLHWDNVGVDTQIGRARCRLCAAGTHSVELYRRQVALFHQRFNEKLSAQRRTWTADPERVKTGGGLAALVEGFRLAHFPPDAFIAFDALRWSDSEVLRHIVRHRKHLLGSAFEGVQLPPGFGEADMLHCLSPTYQLQCRRFYQPLKALLTRQFELVGRAQLQPTGDDAVNPDSADEQAPVVEFVGGFDASTGSLCGVYCSFR